MGVRSADSAGLLAPTTWTCRRALGAVAGVSTLTRTARCKEESTTVSVGPCSVSPRCLMGREVAEDDDARPGPPTVVAPEAYGWR